MTLVSGSGHGICSGSTLFLVAVDAPREHCDSLMRVASSGEAGESLRDGILDRVVVVVSVIVGTVAELILLSLGDNSRESFSADAVMRVSVPSTRSEEATGEFRVTANKWDKSDRVGP